MNTIRILQIGGGSMGKRRLRDLSPRADVQMGLLDPRPDRREECRSRFEGPGFAELDEALAWKPDALVISTPPDHHAAYVELALDRGLHHFSEANIWTYDHVMVREISLARGLVSAVSSSLAFTPVVQELKRVVKEELGTLHGYQMALSSWMPGWHPDEGPEFYARRRATSAGREMVPFELLWLNEVFGPPAKVCGAVSRRGSLPCESEDTWSLAMELEGGGHGQLLGLMASPALYRRGRAWGDAGQVDFDLPAGILERNFPELGVNDCRRFGSFRELLEKVYWEEINAFVDAIRGRAAWPYSYRASSLATATLAAAEQSAASGRWEPVDTARQPQHVPCGSDEVRR